MTGERFVIRRSKLVGVGASERSEGDNLVHRLRRDNTYGPTVPVRIARFDEIREKDVVLIRHDRGEGRANEALRHLRQLFNAINESPLVRAAIAQARPRYRDDIG